MQKTDNLIVYGADWCADCQRAKAILDQAAIPYDYRDTDNDDIHNEMLALTDNRDEIPTLVFGDGSVVQNPDNAALLALLANDTAQGPIAEHAPKESDATTTKSSEADHDLIIIGAGPAALSAAVYTTREDIDTLLFERGVIGGLAAVTDMVDNYPGFPEGIEGLKLADNLRAQAERFGAVIELGEVTKIIDEGDYKRLETTSGDMRARVVLIATGSDYKKIGVPGEMEYYARGVHYCATCDGAFYRDKRLVVIGGGNSAVQEAMFLTRFASHIDLLVRSTVKASEVLQHDLQEHVDAGNITVHLGTTPEEIVGENNKVVKVVASQDGKTVEYPTDGVFVFVGLSPNSQLLEDSGVELDDIGFVKTDAHLQTAVAGIFAAGDIRSGATMQIASATGEGATAALKIREYLEGMTHPLPN